MKHAPGLVVAGAATGVGKTTVAIGLMQALAESGQCVQPFKIGPDFIDPSHHRAACGRAAENLDGWMMSREQNLAVANRATDDADIAIVEGVMGLFDGSGSRERGAETGSTAEMARWLGWPVLLVIDAWRAGRTAAAVVHGLRTFDRTLDFAGVVLNRVAGQGHADMIRQPIEKDVGLPVFGAIPREASVRVPERHLGLHMAGESDLPSDYLTRLGGLVREHVDLEALVSRARPLQPVAPDTGEHSAVTSGQAADAAARADGVVDDETAVGSRESVAIGVARDEAFCFYYPATLRALEDAGAELVEFSPLAGEWPEGVDGLYLGGGYPERFAGRLAEQRDTLDAIAEYSEAGHPIWAECGGFMALCRTLEDEEGNAREMAGVFPVDVEMSDAPTLSYVDVEMDGGAPWFGSETWRGHAFHHSYIQSEQAEALERCFVARSPDGEQVAEGYVTNRTMGSYVHLHGGGQPQFVEAFVELARSSTKTKTAD